MNAFYIENEEELRKTLDYLVNSKVQDGEIYIVENFKLTSDLHIYCPVKIHLNDSSKTFNCGSFTLYIEKNVNCKIS